MMLISNYHEFRKEEFLLIVVSEDDNNYYVRHVPEDYDRFADGKEITALRKSLVGDDGLYKIYDKLVVEQLSLFDL